VLGASFDDVAANARFAAKEAFPFPLLCDTTRTIGLAYGAAQAADQPMAKRISILIGKDGKVEKVYPKVSVGTHAADVLRDAEALG